ncbi:MAG: chromosomal replication initiator protein DnaA [Dehalococcoidia bacterium]|nr:chromosomal replication initiator protein DnaA [Dehalococcoidia bacterium]
MGEASRLWEASLGQLQMQLTKANYDTWLRDTKGLSFDGDKCVVEVPSDFAREWLNSKLKGAAMKTVSDLVGNPVDVSFVVSSGNGRVNGRPASPAPDAAAPPQQARRPRAGLLSRLTFEAFVVSDANRFASTAALAVAEDPGQAYNPLFLYGGLGQGKTHLLHAIGNVSATRGLNVLYASSDQFVRDFVVGIQRGEDDFRHKYRTLDVLLLDDFQFLVGKEKTEEEFLHTFNALMTGERQIVVSCDRTPKLLGSLSERLRTRLEGGLCVEVKPPDQRLREEFLRKRMDDKGVTMSGEVISYLSSHFKISIRELESAYNQVVALSGLTRRPITIELAMEATSGLASPNNRSLPSCDRVIGVVCRYFGVTLEQLESPSREKRLTYARQVAMLLMRDDCQQPLARIGKLLGQRDHSTVLHGANKISAAEAGDQQVRYDLHELRQVLTQPVKQSA